MKAKETKQLLPLNLQFFAADDPDDNLDDDNLDDQNDDNEGDDQNEPGEKTFTQSQVTAMLTREKKEGRRSMLRALGFKSENEAKNALSAAQKLLAGQNDSANDQEDDATVQEALKRAEAAEDKLACIAAGVSKDSIDDALAIAKLKVTEEKTLETVLVEMSKEAKYASFFESEQDNNGKKGTGNDPGHVSTKGKKGEGSYGARLASSVTQRSKEKSSYF